MSGFALKKIKLRDGEDLTHVLLVMNASDFLETLEDYDDKGNLLFVGYAPPGTSEDSPNWAIKAFSHESHANGKPKRKIGKWKGGSADFYHKWSERSL